MKKTLLVTASLVLLSVILFSLASCSAQGKAADCAEIEYDNGYYSAPSEMEKADMNSLSDKYEIGSTLNEASSSTADNLSETGGRKVIFSSSFSVETREFQASCNALESLIGKFGGYIESSEIYSGDGTRYRTRSACYTVRIPVEKYQNFLNESGSIGTVVSRSDNNEDITDSYFDIETRLETLTAKKDRLLALLEDAKQIDDIISLNNALEDTIYQIESLTGTLRKYDSLISYSTVSVYITEVAEITTVPEVNETFGERITSAFKNSIKGLVSFFENFVVFLVAAFPVLVILGAIAAVVIVIIVKSKRRKAKKNSEKI